jgi:hypothetical protein
LKEQETEQNSLNLAKEESSATPAPEKPRTERLRPELTRLPALTTFRKLTRRFLLFMLRLIVRLLAKVTVRGLENVPQQGPALVVSNHLGDADAVVGMAFSPRNPDTLAKADLRDYPVVGWLMEKYGVDMSELPVLDDQLRKIKALAGDKHASIDMPKNRKEADELIEKLANGEA